MKKIVMTVIVCCALTALVTIGASANAFTRQQYSKGAKISIHTARHLALKVFPGTIVSEELEPESGGSGLRYSFDIRRHGSTHEVGVDAVTGRILENSVEGTRPN